jgi:hypothetical protein
VLIVKITLAIVVIFVLASCGSSTPTATLPPVPTNTPQPTVTATTIATPEPRDVPVFQNSFEDITDLAANGITSSNADITTNTENFNYPGGGTALEVKGTLPAAQWSILNVDFSIKKLTGENSLDLTNKTIYYSVFIPADSAIANISLYAGRGGQFVFLAGMTADDYWKKGVWNNLHYDISHAQGLMQDCDTIRIVGQRLSSGVEATTGFLVDDLKWIDSDIFNIPVDDNVDSLRKYAANQHFVFGLWASNQPLFGSDDDPYKNTVYDTRDPWYAYLAAQEGSVNTVWFFDAKPNEDYSIIDYDTEYAGLINQYNFGNGNSMTTLGYGLGCMYSTAPQWIRDLAFPDATRALMLYHIEKDLSYTRGQNPIWLLFNEFILSPEYGAGFKNRSTSSVGIDGYDYGNEWNYYSPWAENSNDSSLIEAAFIKAREVDPGATLLLNDYQDEQIDLARSEYFFQFASGLKAEGIPIDGVGFQMHNYIDPDGTLTWKKPFTWPWEWEHVDLNTYLNNVDLNVRRYARVGLKVAFTEVDGFIKIDDLDLTSAEGRAEYDRRLEWQAKYYAGLLKIAMENENVILYHTWGVTDRYEGNSDTSLPEYSDGYIFDRNYNPKPAYYAMLELLQAP